MREITKEELGEQLELFCQLFPNEVDPAPRVDELRDAELRKVFEECRDAMYSSMTQFVGRKVDDTLVGEIKEVNLKFLEEYYSRRRAVLMKYSQGKEEVQA